MTQPQPSHQRTSPKRRPYFRYLTIALLICCLPFFALGATIAATGTVMVDIEEAGPDGVSLWIPVPVLLFDLAVFAAPMLMPEDALDEARAEIEPFLPALQEFAETLEDCPNGTLVEVEGKTEHVRIGKEGRRLTIRVDSPDADINISVPVRILGRSLDLFG